MAVFRMHTICIILFICTVHTLHGELAYSFHHSKAKRAEDAVADALNYIVENPYSAPEHLFQQLYVVKNYAERYCGRKFNLSEMLLSANNSAKHWKIPEKQLHSLVNFIERNKIYFEFNILCIATEETSDLHIENTCYMDYYSLPFNYYDVHEVIDEIKQCQDIAQFVIDEVPPRITLSATMLICGHMLTATPYVKFGLLLEGAAVNFLLEACNSSAEQKQQEKKQKKHDLRMPLSQKHTADIRQF